MLVTPVPKGIGLMTRAMLMKHIGEVNEKAVDV
jgi:5,10-methylene-tetrahydrofolate dehydrogenase/methenyl tetrahydrofolate cyclohydrolase